jgi:hypothetical protein
MKNKVLAGFTRGMGEENLMVPVLQRLFKREILETVTRDEIIEVLHSEKFLDVEMINIRLGGKCLNNEVAINLLQIVEFFDVDYLSLIQGRLRCIGVTKYSLYTLFDLITNEEKCNDIVSIVEKLSQDERFLCWWSKIEFIIESFDDLLLIYNLDLDMLKINEDELIPVSIGDEISSADMIIKFENFKNR